MRYRAKRSKSGYWTLQFRRFGLWFTEAHADGSPVQYAKSEHVFAAVQLSGSQIDTVEWNQR